MLTIHRSKGLEFPIVYCPDLWEPGYIPRDPQPVFFHDPAHGDARTIDVGLDGPDYPRHRRHHEEEQRGEDLRLAYVALTRARHQAVVWWAGSYDSRHSALGRLLFARGEDGRRRRRRQRDADGRGRGRALRGSSPRRRRAASASSARGSGCRRPGRRRGRAAAELSAAAFDRRLDVRWRRTSFSDISAGAYEARVAQRAGGGASSTTSRRRAGRWSRRSPARADAALLALPAPLAAMPVGLHVGTLVHRVLEAADFAAPDLEAELAARIAAGQGWRHVDLGDAARRRRRV